MGVQVNVVFNVPDLPAADVWFANNIAWKDYWAGIAATATFAGAITNLYVPSPFNNNLVAYNFNVDGVDMIVASIDMFNSLKNQVATLDAAVQDLRTQLKAAGLITQAQ